MQSAYVHYARTPVLYLKQRTDNFYSLCILPLRFAMTKIGDWLVAWISKTFDAFLLVWKPGTPASPCQYCNMFLWSLSISPNPSNGPLLDQNRCWSFLSVIIVIVKKLSAPSAKVASCFSSHVRNAFKHCLRGLWPATTFCLYCYPFGVMARDVWNLLPVRSAGYHYHAHAHTHTHTRTYTHIHTHYSRALTTSYQ